MAGNDAAENRSTYRGARSLPRSMWEWADDDDDDDDDDHDDAHDMIEDGGHGRGREGGREGCDFPPHFMRALCARTPLRRNSSFCTIWTNGK